VWRCATSHVHVAAAPAVQRGSEKFGRAQKVGQIKGESVHCGLRPVKLARRSTDEDRLAQRLIGPFAERAWRAIGEASLAEAARVNRNGSGHVLSCTNDPERLHPSQMAATGYVRLVAAEDGAFYERASSGDNQPGAPVASTVTTELATRPPAVKHGPYLPVRPGSRAGTAGGAVDLVRRRIRKLPGHRRERLSLRSRRGLSEEAGRQEALITALYYEHGRSLLAYATRLTNDRNEAEDVVQETLLRAWKHPEVLVNGQGSVRGWLLTVARNIVVDRARARSARPTEVREHQANPTVAPDKPEDVVDSMAILDAIDRLSPEHRNVLVELYWRGSSVAEAAQRLSVPPGTVKSRAYYGLQTLRGIMASSASGEKESA
jgi:RNA polymerase sigma-70 factor, ECF subfamily